MKTEPGEYAQRLAGDFPALDPKQVQVIGAGWDHIALEVDEELVFRIPRESQTSAAPHSARYEIEVLKRFDSKLPVAVPRPTHIAPDFSYFGYPKLPGVVAFDLLPELDAEHEARLRDDWVKIASIIHDHIPVDVARELSVPVFDPTEIFERASRVEEDASLSDSVRDFAAETVESASRIDLDGEEQYFLHSDFHLKNVLADPHEADDRFDRLV